MRKLGKADRIAATVLGALSLLLAVMLMLDLAAAYRNPDAYEAAYGIPLRTYASQSYAMMAAFGLCFFVSVLALFDRARASAWRVALYVSVLVFMGTIAFAWAVLLSAPS